MNNKYKHSFQLLSLDYFFYTICECPDSLRIYIISIILMQFFRLLILLHIGLHANWIEIVLRQFGLSKLIIVVINASEADSIFIFISFILENI